MAIPVEGQSPLRLLVLPVLLALMEGERTCSDIARQSNLSVSKVNSILEELLDRHLIIETTPLTRDQFNEPRYRIADGEAAMATLTSELSENPIPYVLQILDAVRNELPKAVQQSKSIQAWYSRLILTPEVAHQLVDRLFQLMNEFEEMQTPAPLEASDGSLFAAPQRNSYRLCIAFYQVGAEETHP
ncbi:hypothetical protein [Ktedonobacter robiniae]|uniref:HTH marR-type domain-containing protein n=1 Tax=Ktedonobacter robiniae TaxID=2778365 RepID=A0ABQ3UZ69_9CHLR|nr:hypothetical protein [Ktedonobacter robiniae]GHO57954.1 hypothetical protein KSB_64290 [Ktedonobacter robiniae]